MESKEQKTRRTDRPSDAGPDAEDRPRLRAKPVGTAEGEAEAAEAAEAGKRAGTLFEESDGNAPKARSRDEAADKSEAGPSKVVPPLKDYPYATHRPAPRTGEEQEEKGAKQPSSPAPEASGEESEADGELEVSPGFLLGVALVIVVLVGGLWLAHLQGEVNALQSRLEAVETPLTANAPPAP